MVEIGIPLIIGVLLLAAPSLFVKKRGEEAAYLKANKTLEKCGFGLLAAAALLLAANANQLFKSQVKSTESFLATIVDQNNRILPKQVDEFPTPDLGTGECIREHVSVSLQATESGCGGGFP